MWARLIDSAAQRGLVRSLRLQDISSLLKSAPMHSLHPRHSFAGSSSGAPLPHPQQINKATCGSASAWDPMKRGFPPKQGSAASSVSTSVPASPRTLGAGWHPPVGHAGLASGRPKHRRGEDSRRHRGTDFSRPASGKSKPKAQNGPRTQFLKKKAEQKKRRGKGGEGGQSKRSRTE